MRAKHMSQYEADVIKPLTQIVEDLRWIKVSLEQRDRVQEEENPDFLTRIEKRIGVPPLSNGNSKTSLTSVLRGNYGALE